MSSTTYGYSKQPLGYKSGYMGCMFTDYIIEIRVRGKRSGLWATLQTRGAVLFVKELEQTYDARAWLSCGSFRRLSGPTVPTVES